MANIKELRGRIRSVGNIAKITKAMEMVASMKLRKIQARALGFRPYTEELRALVGHVAHALREQGDLPQFATREVRTTAIFVVTSDRGLCGAYNANVLNRMRALATELRREHAERKFKFYVYGQRGHGWLVRRGYAVERFYHDPPLEALDFQSARNVGKALSDAFVAGEVEDVRLVYTSFLSASRFEARADRFLPVTDDLISDAIAARDRAEGAFHRDYLIEPDPQTVFDRLLPRYIETMIFGAMLESLAAEMASRRMAMKGATDAAGRMGRELKRRYNRARQESITKELLDIVGGASAVS
jgi:F-type H+-transporting ATPase subunit gamma